MQFEFHNPYYLLLLLLIPVIEFFYFKKKSGTILFSSTQIASKSSHKHKSSGNLVINTLRVLGLALLILGLARPQFFKGESYIEASGVDIMLAVDISSSMLALDLSTPDDLKTRLDVSKEVIKDFISKRDHDRIGLIAFSGDPYLVSPITLNHDWLNLNINRLDFGLVEDGTAIGSAIGMATNRLKNLESKSKIIILLTDGVNNAGRITPIVAAEAAKSFDTKIYTIAVGKGGIVPTFLLDQNKNIAKNPYGKKIVAQAEILVDEATLEKVAAATGGKHFRASNKEELAKIYSEIDKLEKTEVKLKHYGEHDELYFYPVTFGFILLIIEQILAATRYRRLP